MMRTLITTLTLLLFVGVTTSSTLAAKYKVTKVSNGGKITGMIHLKGSVPKPERIAVAKNPEACGTEDRMIQWVETGNGGGLQNMVVYLHKVKEGKDWPKKSGDFVIDQVKCDFKPWLQILPKGSKLTVKNSDPVLHNIHIRELKGVRPGRKYRPVKATMYNEGQPPGSGDINTEIKARMRGNLIRVNCEAHNFMFAWMFAADNPYAVYTGKDGSFTIDNIPPGKHILRAWHPTLGLKEKKLEVKAGETLSHHFTYKTKKS